MVANPVEAGLVERPSHWPGVLLWGEQRRGLARPHDYFDPDGSSPQQLELVVTAPAGAKTTSSWIEMLETAIRARVEKAHRSMAELGMRFLGKAAVLAASFIERAKSYEVKRQLVPTVAAACREVRIRVLKEYRAFHVAYFRARSAWCAGDRSAVFPIGTWWMRVHHAAAVDDV